MRTLRLVALSDDGTSLILAAEGPDSADSGERFDVVLTDIAMPGADGHALLRALHARPSTGAVPVVAVTGFARAADVQRSSAAGFAGHLGKPVSIDAVLRLLFEHVAKPEFTVRWRWRAGDVAFWDNRLTQHYALADTLPHRRVMHRATILGDRPQ